MDGARQRKTQPSGTLEDWNRNRTRSNFSLVQKSERERVPSGKRALQSTVKVAEMLSQMLSQISGEQKDGWLMSFLKL
jgi:hypothetical protein